MKIAFVVYKLARDTWCIKRAVKLLTILFNTTHNKQCVHNGKCAIIWHNPCPLFNTDLRHFSTNPFLLATGTIKFSIGHNLPWTKSDQFPKVTETKLMKMDKTIYLFACVAFLPGKLYFHTSVKANIPSCTAAMSRPG